MSLAALLNRLNFPGEQYILQELTAGTSENDFGDVQETWTDVQQLTCTIQGASEDPDGVRGSEETGDYVGVFLPNFELQLDDLARYRIKHIFPATTPLVRYFRIKDINTSLKMNHQIHHYEMTLEISKKG